MSEYKYDFADFLNDTADAPKLQNEILASSIDDILESITIEYGNEEVKIIFETDLSAGEQTTLDGIVAAHDGIPYVQMGSGWAESNGESGTTSDLWQEKISMNFNCTEAGTHYKLYWYFEAGCGDSDKKSEFRVRLHTMDGIEVRSTSDIMNLPTRITKKISDGNWISVCGFKILQLEVEDYQIDIDYRNMEGKITYIRCARLCVEQEG